MEESKKREQEFHDELFSHNTRQSVHTFYAITKNARKKYLSKIVSNCQNKKVLEYGCGADGSDSFALASNGANVIGIDISSIAMQKASLIAKEKRMENRVTFVVGDGEHMEFPNNFFDMAVGSGILHHLNIEKALRELSRVLKPKGKIIFIEPLGYNPIINIYRLLSPSLRTKDEHPLLQKDLNLFKSFFQFVHFDYYNMLTLLAIPFIGLKVFSPMLEVLEGIDQILFRLFSIIRIMAWEIIIIASDPI